MAAVCQDDEEGLGATTNSRLPRARGGRTQGRTAIRRIEETAAGGFLGLPAGPGITANVAARQELDCKSVEVAARPTLTPRVRACACPRARVINLVSTECQMPTRRDSVRETVK